MSQLKRFVRRVVASIEDGPFAVRFWDGEYVAYGSGSPRFIIECRDERVCRSLLWQGDVAFGEAYAAGAIEVHGDLFAFMRAMFRVRSPARVLERLPLAAMAIWHSNTRRRAARNVQHHYDLGNEFFAAWLGKEMAYSCGYFRSPHDDLDTAQRAKFEHICAKLCLRSSQTLLDIGCGWGGLLIHAATHHGVRGLGITLSAAQKAEAERRIAAAGLGDRLRIELRDYRELPADIRFDRIVSVGMFEHVGKRYIDDYLTRTRRALRDEGVGLLHTIGRHTPRPPNRWLTKHIFPGAYFPTLADIAQPMSTLGLTITDVEVLRLHYALTIERWIGGFEAYAEVVRRQFGVHFERMWRLYLHGCAAAFRYGDYCVWQVQFSKGSSGDVPITREYLYQ